MSRKDQSRNAQFREGRDWWACPAEVENAWHATRREGLHGGGSSDPLAHQACCERWAQGPSSLCCLKTNFVMPNFAKAATGGLVPPKSKMLGVLHGARGYTARGSGGPLALHACCERWALASARRLMGGQNTWQCAYNEA